MWYHVGADLVLLLHLGFVLFVIAGGLLLPFAFIGAICLYEYLTERYGRGMGRALRVAGFVAQMALAFALTDALIRWWGQP